MLLPDWVGTLTEGVGVGLVCLVVVLGAAAMRMSGMQSQAEEEGHG